jgi:hypothetical protein
MTNRNRAAVIRTVLSLLAVLPIVSSRVLSQTDTNYRNMDGIFTSHGINSSDVFPWHMKVSYKTYDKDDNLKDYGTYEEYRLNKTIFRSTFTSTFFSINEYGTNKGIVRTGSKRNPIFLVDQIPLAMTSPLPEKDELLAYDLKEEGKIGAPKKRTSDEAKDLSCIDVNFKNHEGNSAMFASYCYDNQKILSRYTVQAGLIIATADVKDRAVFRNRILPSDLVIHGGLSTVIAHLDVIEGLSENDRDKFVPPPDAVTIEDPYRLGVD